MIGEAGRLARPVRLPDDVALDRVMSALEDLVTDGGARLRLYGEVQRRAEQTTMSTLDAARSVYDDLLAGRPL